MLLDLLGVEGVSGVVYGVLVYVSAEDSLTELGTDVFSTASVAMSTSADFVVE